MYKQGVLLALTTVLLAAGCGNGDKSATEGAMERAGDSFRDAAAFAGKDVASAAAAMTGMASRATAEMTDEAAAATAAVTTEINGNAQINGAAVIRAKEAAGVAVANASGKPEIP